MTLKNMIERIPTALLSIVTVCTASQAAVLTVGQPNTPCPSAQYTTIGAAVAAASSGDTIAICPALYPEQLIITQPLTLMGLDVAITSKEGKYGINRVLIQPTLTDLQNLPYESVITVMNTSRVTIQNLAIDASLNTVSGCSPTLSDVHFFNSSGKVVSSALSGAELPDVSTCSGLFGNGFGVLVDSDGSLAGPFNVSVLESSIHDYEQDGIYVVGPGAGVSPAIVNVTIAGNSISGIGPASGTLQFGVFLNGAVGQITGNRISEGLCGSLTISPDCVNLRSEGVTLRSVGAGTVVDGNIINDVQSGIFINGVTQAKITNNVIGNVEGLDGMDIEGLTDSLIEGNVIFNALPVSNESCGIWEDSGTGDSGNTISNTTVNDAYCGVEYVSADHVTSGTYFNTLYTTFNGDLNPNALPPIEPGQSAPASAAFRSSHH
ncbi:MAG TPA: right-handed parallel beta-helix repeat-containing protein [Bryobacteraceae bacterium]|nr:right-handed parallel beta-helix repeat-containing protein [Bryobacteraceae bacterium]